MKKIMGILLCVPLVALIAGVSRWATMDTALSCIVIHIVSWVIGVLTGFGTILFVILAIRLAYIGLKMLFKRGDK